MGLHLVRKLENFFRFSFGPSVDKVFNIGLTLSVAFGAWNTSRVCKRWHDREQHVPTIGLEARTGRRAQVLRFGSGRIGVNVELSGINGFTCQRN